MERQKNKGTQIRNCGTIQAIAHHLTVAGRDPHGEPICTPARGEINMVEIYTDGACKGNPGVGGWGAILRFGDTEKELFGGVTSTTNNRMEMTAVIEALRALSRSCDAIVFTDSSYVQKGISEWIHGWKRNGWKTAGKKPVKNADLWQTLDQLAAGHKIEWRWVKGHAGHPENERADQLANRGVESVLAKLFKDVR